MRSRSSVARRAQVPLPGEDGFPTAEPDPKPTVGTSSTPASPTSEVPGTAFDRIAGRLFAVDVDAEYDELERDLKLSIRASRADYGSVIDALDVAEDNARRAMALYVNSKLSDEAFQIDALAITAAMRKEAVRELNASKIDEEGKPIKGMKQITEADVAAYCASQYADEWRDIELRKVKSKQTTVYLERLADLWKQRARDLQVIAANARQ